MAKGISVTFDALDFFSSGLAFPENYAQGRPVPQDIPLRLLKVAGLSLSPNPFLHSVHRDASPSVQEKIFFEQGCRTGDISRAFAQMGWRGYAVDTELARVRQAIMSCPWGVSFACGPLNFRSPEPADLSFHWHCGLALCEAKGPLPSVTLEDKLMSLRQSTKVCGSYIFDIRSLHPAHDHPSGSHRVLVDIEGELAVLSWERQWSETTPEGKKSTTSVRVMQSDHLLWESPDIIENHPSVETVEEILRSCLDRVRWMGTMDGDRPAWHHKRLIGVVKRMS